MGMAGSRVAWLGGWEERGCWTGQIPGEQKTTVFTSDFRISGGSGCIDPNRLFCLRFTSDSEEAARLDPENPESTRFTSD